MEKILVVDDQPYVRRALARTLKHAGFCCEFAGNVDEAIQWLLRADFSLVLTDMNMPGGRDGLDLLRWAKENRSNLPVIVASALADRRTVLSAEKLGAKTYLTKPLRPESTIAAVRRTLAAASNRAARTQVEQAGPQADGGKKILVVDDQPCIRRTLGRVLREVGLSCEFASDTDEAMRLLQGGAYELVLSDIDMPGDKTGVDLVRWMREQMPQTPVIVISGVSDDDVITTVMELGAQAYLLKPFFPQQALIAIRSALAKPKRLADAKARQPARFVKSAAQSPSTDRREDAAERPAPVRAGNETLVGYPKPALSAVKPANNPKASQFCRWSCAPTPSPLQLAFAPVA